MYREDVQVNLEGLTPEEVTKFKVSLVSKGMKFKSAANMIVNSVKHYLIYSKKSKSWFVSAKSNLIDVVTPEEFLELKPTPFVEPSYAKKKVADVKKEEESIPDFSFDEPTKVDKGEDCDFMSALKTDSVKPTVKKSSDLDSGKAADNSNKEKSEPVKELVSVKNDTSVTLEDCISQFKSQMKESFNISVSILI